MSSVCAVGVLLVHGFYNLSRLPVVDWQAFPFEATLASPVNDTCGCWTLERDLRYVTMDLGNTTLLGGVETTLNQSFTVGLSEYGETWDTFECRGESPMCAFRFVAQARLVRVTVHNFDTWDGDIPDFAAAPLGVTNCSWVVESSTTEATTTTMAETTEAMTTTPTPTPAFDVHWGLSGGHRGDTSVLGSIVCEEIVSNVTAVHPLRGVIPVDVYYAPCDTNNVLDATEWIGGVLELFGMETNAALQRLVQRHCQASKPKVWVVPRSGRGEILVDVQLLPVFGS
jgi:hypothetical protein